jgi:hypothetical protein
MSAAGAVGDGSRGPITHPTITAPKGNRTTMESTRIGRFWAALAATLALVIAFNGTAAAAPSSHIEEHFVSVVGVPISAPGANAYLQAYHSDYIGSNAGFEMWLEPEMPWTGPPTYTSGQTTFTVGAGDSSLTGTFVILDAADNPVGIGTLDASLSPIGEPQNVTWPKSSGNEKHRESQVYQDMLVSGTVTVAVGGAQYVFPLDGATAFAADFTAFRNSPASSVDWQTFTELGMFATSGDMTIQLRMDYAGRLALTDVVIQAGDEYFVGRDSGESTRFFGNRYELNDVVSATGGGDGGQGIAAGSASGGTVIGSATIRPAERLAWTETVGGMTLRFAVQTYRVSGSFTVALDDGRTATFTMDDANGFAQRVSSRLIIQPGS